MHPLLIDDHLTRFFKEDIQFGDLSADSIFAEADEGTGIIICKDQGIFCGASVIEHGFRLLSPQTKVSLHKKDGDKIAPGDKLATITAPVRSLLTGERTILNLIQRMSGIASLTYKAVQTLNAKQTRICDTRKTTPGLRLFEKYAVTCGGGFNHRSSVNDGVMIKDNHIAYCGSITEAVKQAKEKVGPMIQIEVETESEIDVIEAVQAGANIIMFDNRSPEEVIRFMKHIPPHIKTEASGGITLDTLADYSKTNVDYISLGFLTYHASALDFSMLVDGGNKR